MSSPGKYEEAREVGARGRFYREKKKLDLGAESISPLVFGGFALTREMQDKVYLIACSFPPELDFCGEAKHSSPDSAAHGYVVTFKIYDP